MENATVTTQAQESSGLLAVIEKAAHSPDIDVNKMKELLDLQERVMKKQAEISFNQAMARLQPLMPAIAKSGRIEFVDKNKESRSTPFAKYEDIDNAIRPFYTKEGFSISYNTEWLTDRILITGTLSHVEGHFRTASVPLPLDTSGSKNNLQAMGSTISYGKRYLLTMLFNIVTKGEDDDGAGANEPIEPEKLEEITRLLTEVKADKARFLQFMAVDDLKNIRRKDYRKALNALNAKRTQPTTGKAGA